MLLALCAIQQMSAEGAEQPKVGTTSRSSKVSGLVSSQLAAALCDA